MSLTPFKAIIFALEYLELRNYFHDDIIGEILMFFHPFNVEFGTKKNMKIAFLLMKNVSGCSAEGWRQEIIRLICEYDHRYMKWLRCHLQHKATDCIKSEMADLERKVAILEGTKTVEEYNAFYFNTTAFHTSLQWFYFQPVNAVGDFSLWRDFSQRKEDVDLELKIRRKWKKIRNDYWNEYETLPAWKKEKDDAERESLKQTKREGRGFVHFGYFFSYCDVCDYNKECERTGRYPFYDCRYLKKFTISCRCYATDL